MVMQILITLSPAENGKEDIKEGKEIQYSTCLTKKKMSCIPHPSAPLLAWKI